MPNPEHLSPSPESTAEKPKDFERAPEILDNENEKTTEESPEENERAVEKAREEVNKEAISGRETSQGEHKQVAKESYSAPRSRRESYAHTMKSVQKEMSAPARAFSKIIHNKAVERTSEVIGGTVARPDAILSGSIFACIIVLGLYTLARYYGFSLTGSETIGAFVIGWAIGIIFDLLRAVITGKRQ